MIRKENYMNISEKMILIHISKIFLRNGFWEII